MSISVIEFGALQPHWMLARWDASVPHTLERLNVKTVILSYQFSMCNYYYVIKLIM